MNKYTPIDFNLIPKETLLSLLDESASIYSDDIALIFKSEIFSFKEINEQANRLAHYLIKIGVQPGDYIGVALNRSPKVLISLLAVLKSGAAYIPIDVHYPTERILYMLEESSAKVVLTSKEFSGQFNNLSEEISLDEIWKTLIDYPKESPLEVKGIDQIAYVMYTSGSTGNPKGVQISHSALLNFLKSIKKSIGIQRTDKLLAITTISFDIAGLELFVPLISGAQIVLLDEDDAKNGSIILDVIRNKNITIMQATPATWTMMLYENWEDKLPIKILCGGEALSKDLAKKLLSRSIEVWNMYGPTETTIWSTMKKLSIDEETITIGCPIDNTEIYILDKEQQQVPQGNIGEIYIGGAGIALGYLNKPELTKEKFIDNPFDSTHHSKLYSTGDIGLITPNGEIQCLGRMDHQVKIRGHRIELGEIEYNLIQDRFVKEAVVVAREDIPGDIRLCAYIIPLTKLENGSIHSLKMQLKESLKTQLPEYMVPNDFVFLSKFPLTLNEKIDRKKLPKPENTRPELPTLYLKPSTKSEHEIEIVWNSILQIDKIGINDNFFDLGGNSLLAVKSIAELKNIFNFEIPITKLYQFPTIKSLSQYVDNEIEIKAFANNTINKNDEILETERRTSADKSVTKNTEITDIAIIGMSCRFPGANTITQLWEILKNAQETTTFFSLNEIDSSIPDEVKNNVDYVPARGIISDAATFDPDFFGINKKLAELIDPQHRIFLEISWEALESSGYTTPDYKGSIGVFAGSANNTYYLNNVQHHQELIDNIGVFQVTTANEKDYLSTRTSYCLNLKGPAVVVQSACSTSLLAVAQAVENLRSGKCDMALAGGVSIISPINSGHLYQEGSMQSSDGHCRPFDSKATGTVFSDGAGVVLLKPLKQALEDGDTIYSVIKGIGLSNDGSGKGSFTAPSSEGQAAAISMAIKDAQTDPNKISYIETHGTATPLGDPIEIEGLKQAFGLTDKKQFCAIGSIKGNMGHLNTAAGIAGLIKSSLALYHKQIPASINYTNPNPHINFNDSPFRVNTSLKDWEIPNECGKRIAGVSSFGVGGTNVHLILEEYKTLYVNHQNIDRPVNLFGWSAKSLPSLQSYASKLLNYLQQENKPNLSDLAYTLQTTKTDFNYRTFVVAESAEELEKELEQSTSLNQPAINQLPGETVFLFPGQGAQYLKMGLELYTNEPIFRLAIDECATLLIDILDKDIRDIMYADEKDEQARINLNNTKYTQPALFVTEYALAKLWMNWGIQPTILCGHSIGEYVAAHLAGIFSLKDALNLIANRGLLVSKLPKGSMLSIRAQVNEIRKTLPENLSVAAVNSENLCVIAGDDKEVDHYQLTLNNLDILNQKLHTSHAFHSAMMDPVLNKFTEIVAQVKLNIPRIPIISTVTGELLTDTEALNPAYWVKHLRETVQFSAALSNILSMNNPVLIEIGPGTTCTTLTYQHKAKSPFTAVASLDNKKIPNSLKSILSALGKVWQSGLSPNWNTFYNDQKRQRIKSPTYSFNKKTYWVEHKASSTFKQIKPENHINMRKDNLIQRIKQILENASGIEMDGQSTNLSFIEIGLDSLLLTQVAISLKKEFNLPITFRKLHEEYSTIDSLADYIDKNTVNNTPEPIEVPNKPQVVLPMEQSFSQPKLTQPILANHFVPNPPAIANDTSIGLIAQQLEILSKQIMLMQSQPLINNNVNPHAPQHFVPPKAEIETHQNDDGLSQHDKNEIKKPFGATPKIERTNNELNSKQLDFIKQLTQRYNQRTQKSKQYTDDSRPYMSDPRVVSGFRPLTKELVYPIVINKSNGSRLFDIDGNEYIDALNGFGSNMLGYQHKVIKQAMLEQIEKGYEVGPQHELAAEVSKLVCEFTGFERTALCSTGSEAVLGCIRIARTVTGRSLIVAFTGSYHGIIDEVLVRGTKKLKSFPAVAGVMPESVQNILVLDYGTDESLEIIKARANEIAAVLVEPVQSRRPEFVPIEFVKKLREITSTSGSALIFDEVITGFRMHPGGAQALFGIRADLASYGKVVGAGVPIGVIAGKKHFMDALDGGSWQYGDNSFPEVGVTYFAGTFVRHPLALASAVASLNYMKEKGPALQEELNEKGDRITKALNKEIEKRDLPFFATNYGSLWKIKFSEEIPYSELLFTLMREKGIHILDGFPCFITEAMTDQDIDQIIECFIESVDEMINADFFHKGANAVATDDSNHKIITANKPPINGARLGKDNDGNPAWFIKDENNPGKYLQLQI